MPLSLDNSVAIPEQTLFREVAGEAVLLQLEAGMYFGLDAVGTRLWQLMAEHGKLRTVLDVALDEFEVSPTELERDLLDLVNQLETRRLVSVV